MARDINHSPTSLEAFHSKEEIDSYLDHQSFHFYAKSLERRTSELQCMFGKYYTSIESHDLYGSFGGKVESRKNLKLLELLETEN